MIITLRRSIKSKAFKVILWVTLIAASGVLSVFQFISGRFFGNSSSDWIVQINKQKIYAPEFKRAVTDQEERIRFMRAQYGQYADLYFQMMGMKADPSHLALNFILRKVLLNEVANKLPLYVDSDAVQNQISNPTLITQEISDLIPFSTWDQSLGGVNPLALNAYLQSIGVSAETFNHELAQAIKRNDLKNLVEHSAYIPEFELKEKFAQNFLGHKFSIITIPAADILAQVKKEAVSDDELKQYFNLKSTQEKRYYVPEKRTAKVISFDPATYGITVTDQDIQNYYNNNKAQFVEQPAQVQVRRIVLKVANQSKDHEVRTIAEALRQELLKNPEQFAAKAKEVSQDKESAAQGGLVPYFSKGKHEKVFEKTSFLLKEDGALSDLIRTTQGYELVQRVGKKMQTFKLLAQVSKDIKDVITQKKFAERFAGDVRAVINQPAALEKFIQDKHGKETTSKDVVADNSVLSKTIYRIKEKESSFYQEPNKGVIVTLITAKASYLPSFDELKNQIKEDYYKDQAAKKLAKNVSDIQNGIIAFDAIKDGTKPKKTGWLYHSKDRKEDEAEKTALQKEGIDLERIFQIENKGGIAAYQSNGTGYIIRLDELAPFDPALYDQKKKALFSELEQQQKQLVMAGFVASLYRNAKINRNDLKSV